MVVQRMHRLAERVEHPVHREALLAVTALLAFVHFAIFLLASAQRTGPYLEHSPHSLTGWFVVVDAASIWIPAHGLAAFALAVAATGRATNNWCKQSVRFSFVALVLWGTVTLLWSLQQHPPVSLLGPVLTVLFATLALWVDRQWDDREG